ncbi:transcription termination protein NusA [Euzebya pacifica]|uniref:Ribosome maturation factor RimP n=1 Tax=Euzebya pacifica TaxID=1608957 RepID=A0A346Y0R9_9ACTN|nr:ribosome maturation factor RimP [Euzebya pacifica]AXV08066.1 transcription termination protein NusA [Euzebya pacifica]
MAATLIDTIDELARPLADEAELDLVDVEVKGGGGRTRIRVIVDRKGGVDVGTCQKLSKRLARLLDDHDPIKDRYTLEVTSPGTDWPLRTQRDFDRVEGRLVKVVHGDEDQSDEVVGEIASTTPEAVVVRDKAGDTHEISYDRIMKATQQLPW